MILSNVELQEARGVGGEVTPLTTVVHVVVVFVVIEAMVVGLIILFIELTNAVVATVAATLIATPMMNCQTLLPTHLIHPFHSNCTANDSLLSFPTKSDFE